MSGLVTDKPSPQEVHESNSFPDSIRCVIKSEANQKEPLYRNVNTSTISMPTLSSSDVQMTELLSSLSKMPNSFSSQSDRNSSHERDISASGIIHDDNDPLSMDQTSQKSSKKRQRNDKSVNIYSRQTRRNNRSYAQMDDEYAYLDDDENDSSEKKSKLDDSSVASEIDKSIYNPLASGNNMKEIVCMFLSSLFQSSIIDESAKLPITPSIPSQPSSVSSHPSSKTNTLTDTAVMNPNLVGPDEVVVSLPFFNQLVSGANVAGMQKFLNRQHYRFAYYPCDGNTHVDVNNSEQFTRCNDEKLSNSLSHVTTSTYSLPNIIKQPSVSVSNMANSVINQTDNKSLISTDTINAIPVQTHEQIMPFTISRHQACIVTLPFTPPVVHHPSIGSVFLSSLAPPDNRKPSVPRPTTFSDGGPRQTGSTGESVPLGSNVIPPMHHSVTKDVLNEVGDKKTRPTRQLPAPVQNDLHVRVQQYLMEERRRYRTSSFLLNSSPHPRHHIHSVAHRSKQSNNGSKSCSTTEHVEKTLIPADSQRGRSGTSDGSHIASFRRVEQGVMLLKRSTQVWSKEEDDALESAALKYHRRCWKRIAEAVGSRNDVQCRQRYYFLHQENNTGRWSEDENRILLESIENGLTVSQIVGIIPRSVKQIKDRFEILSSPDRPWSSAETILLFGLVDKLGYKWNEYARHFRNRTAGRIEEKYWIERRIMEE